MTQLKTVMSHVYLSRGFVLVVDILMMLEFVIVLLLSVMDHAGGSTILYCFCWLVIGFHEIIKQNADKCVLAAETLHCTAA